MIWSRHIDTHELYDLIDLGYKYEIRYIDYPEGAWTVPLDFTNKRMHALFDDASISMVRITDHEGNRYFLSL